MRVSRITANISVQDIERATSFFTDYLGLDHEEMGLEWVTRFVAPASGEHVQVVTRDATAMEDSVITVRVADVDAAYAEACTRGYEIVHPLVTEKWGVRRFFVRVPGGGVVNVAQEHPSPR
jgi:catechol 2,3-dioxygenase-like lactoylglutathione lyase family enzyme